MKNLKNDQIDDEQLRNIDITSQMSSINQSLLDNQPSNVGSRSFVDLEQESTQREDTGDIKEAIIDLYLAIKIRSTEELDKINDGNLKTEKEKLMDNVDAFQILEYIRSSIEIIMNLKIEDLERNDDKNPNSKKPTTKNQIDQITDDISALSIPGGNETSISAISVESKNLIQQSMKDALLHMIENKETRDAINYKKCAKTGGAPMVYEKIIQKLEADIRGHIRLEHEMKIHMDYLEGKVEKFEKEQKSHDNKVQLLAQ